MCDCMDNLPSHTGLFKVCHVHVVLSTLYQEKIVTEQDVKDLKSREWPWLFLVQIQCTKPPDIVRRTAVLLVEVLRNEEATLLKGK